MNSHSELHVVLLYHRQRRHLHNRALIHLPRPHHIVKHRKQNHTPCHQHAKIHTLRRNGRSNRPKAEEENDNPKHHREHIHQDPEDTWKPKRSPKKLVSLAGIVRDVARFADGTRASAPEEEAFGDDVGGVEAADAEGDDVVEGGGRADVDKADEAGDDGCYHDGEKRNCGFGLDLRDVSQSVRLVTLE